MRPVRNTIGGLGNLMFKEAFLYGLLRQGLIPDLYLQDYKYWEPYTGELKHRFGEGIEYKDRVSLHIRRGDYLNTNFYVNLWETDYYQRATAMFPNEKFLVFCFDRQDKTTDNYDRDWTIKFLDSIIPGRYELWEPQSETDDLNAMAGCKSNILANSSFSWWAGFLNPNPDKKVIVPKIWFKDGVERCKLLEDWIKI